MPLPLPGAMPRIPWPIPGVLPVALPDLFIPVFLYLAQYLAPRGYDQSWLKLNCLSQTTPFPGFLFHTVTFPEISVPSVADKEY